MSRQQTQPFSARPQELPVKADLARLRVEYGKSDRLAYLGHLDLIATIERCVRRAGLPFSLGNGFARRMRIQFSSALPTGTSSACEYFDLRLTEEVDPKEALGLLRAATPSALVPVRAAYVPGRLPALEAWLNQASWEIACAGAPFSAEALLEGVSAVRERGQITYLRGEKEKRVDVASSLVDVTACDSGGGVVVRLETRSSGAGALRPQVLLNAALGEAGLEPPRSVSARRLAQWHEENGRLVEPFGPFVTSGDTPLS
ncbi:TIGR03936 family radical SAM-associated protein [Thermophilibacter provencensis]|uniref:TIGR03936 family radical SAM-associated protein n=1 Tax=Thermophilibacter provencensis TaxID=1852386 RepID=A0ABT7V4M2_9ACTN|nr:TIGR03936 family radical SAM-associated protein [Thermophilibacter provencensis]MDM8270924.1 TIGR03936 family radical SAM-associated protein [Thermophilibacter provencensis]